MEQVAFDYPFGSFDFAVKFIVFLSD